MSATYKSPTSALRRPGFGKATAVRDWVKQAEVDAGSRHELRSDEREELSRLGAENRRLRGDVEILKRATAFFAKETR
jgi:transposase